MKGGKFPLGVKSDDASVPRLLRAIRPINGRLYLSLHELELCKWELGGGRGSQPFFDGPDRLISAAEACRGLGICRRTLRRWIEQAEAHEAAEAARNGEQAAQQSAEAHA